MLELVLIYAGLQLFGSGINLINTEDGVCLKLPGLNSEYVKKNVLTVLNLVPSLDVHKNTGFLLIELLVMMLFMEDKDLDKLWLLLMEDMIVALVVITELNMVTLYSEPGGSLIFTIPGLENSSIQTLVIFNFKVVL